MWRVQIPVSKLPFKAQPREESHSNCHFYRKSGCTYVYEAIPVVVYISALYKAMHNITKMFTHKKCSIDLTEKNNYYI